MTFLINLSFPPTSLFLVCSFFFSVCLFLSFFLEHVELSGCLWDRLVFAECTGEYQQFLKIVFIILSTLPLYHFNPFIYTIKAGC